MKQWQIQSKGKIALVEGEESNLDHPKIKLTKMSVVALDERTYSQGAAANYPIVPVRQAVGIVVENSNEQSSFARGSRVMLSPYNSCGACCQCKSGHFELCERLIVYGLNADGFLRDFIRVPESQLFDLPDHVKDNDVLYVDNIALALNAINKLEVKKGEYIAIIGAGITGICLAQAAIYYQAIPILIDNNEQSLSLAQELGIYYTINFDEGELDQKIGAMTGGKLCECVVYNCNSGAQAAYALDYAANDGRIVFLGWDLVGGKERTDFTPIVQKHLTIMGISNGYKFIPNAINMLANRIINISGFPIKERAFAEANEVFESGDLDYSTSKIIIKN